LIYFRLQELCDKYKVSRRLVARECDIRQDTFNSMCNNDVIMIRIEHIDRLCKYFNCEPGEIIKFIEEK